MSNIAELANIPDVVLTDTKTLEQMQEEFLADYAAGYEAAAGKSPTLAAGDPVRIVSNQIVALGYQLKQYIETAGRQNMLKYSTGEALKNIGALKKVTVNAAGCATTTLRFSMEDARTVATPITAGTEVTTEDDVVFTTDAYAEIPAGSLYVDVAATASEAGTSGNGIQAGALDTMTDPVAYVDAVTNTTETSGGTADEDDDSLTRRIYLAPDGFSTAGPEAAYIAKALEMDNVEDVRVATPNPCYVSLVFVMDGGALPSADQVTAMSELLNDKTIRPMGDRLTVAAPEEVSYSISLAYYIAKSDESKVDVIKSAVDAAVTAYQTWQRTLGRDINPDQLTYLLRSAGAKRAVIASPAYTAVDDLKIAKCGNVVVTYGGVEND